MLWSYASTLLSRRPPAHPLLLFSVAWAVIGFIGAYRVSQMTSPEA